MALALIAVIFIIAGTLFENEKLSIGAIVIGMSLFLLSTVSVYDEYQERKAVTQGSITETSIRTDDETGIQYISNSIFVMTDKNIPKALIAPQIESISGVTATVTDMQHGVFHVVLNGEEKTLDELELLSHQMFSIDGVCSAAVDIYHEK